MNVTACTGSSDCPATTHIHGCFADRGSCDQPREHSDIDTLAATVEDALDAYWDPPSEAHSALDALVEHVRTLERERNEALERELRNRLLLNHADARADRIEKTLDDNGGCTNYDCRLYIPPEDAAPESVLEEAARLVGGDRQQAYGHPRDNHACTAALWNAYLERRDIGTVNELDAYDVCLLNILQKVSRLAHSRHRDGLVDLAGFAANADMVDE